MGVTGKRRVKAPVSPTVSPNLGQYKLPYAESEFDTSSHSDSSIAEDVPPTSERAKRARRRASLDVRIMCSFIASITNAVIVHDGIK